MDEFSTVRPSPPDIDSDCCPLCTGHKDSELIWHELANVYVCLGCRHEIDCGLDFEEQPTIDNYNCYDTIERLLDFLGITYAELQQRHNSKE